MKEDVFNQFPTLYADDYILRQPMREDAEDYLAYISDPKVNAFVPNECLPKTVEDAVREIVYFQDLFRYKRSIYWVVARKEDNKMIGSCGFNYWSRDHNRAEISYDLARPYWRSGITSKAVSTVLGFAFSQMQLNRIEATVTPTNIASFGLLKKLKFQKEGVLRQQKLLHGQYHDAIMLSLLSKDYLKF